jgi:hypothetical protein
VAYIATRTRLAVKERSLVGCIEEDVTERAELRKGAERRGSPTTTAWSREMQDETLELECLLDYELRCSERYRRPLSLVTVVPMNTRINPRSLLFPALRGSDQLFEVHGHAAILMSETNCQGALAAIGRYSKMCEGEIDLRFAVVSYPEDGGTVRELLATAQQRLDKAMTLEPGAIVAAG